MIEFKAYRGAVATRACCSKHVSGVQQLRQNLPEHDAFQLLPTDRPTAKIKYQTPRRKKPKNKKKLGDASSSLNIVRRPTCCSRRRNPSRNRYPRALKHFLASRVRRRSSIQPLGGRRCFWNERHLVLSAFC